MERDLPRVLLLLALTAAAACSGGGAPLETTEEPPAQLGDLAAGQYLLALNRGSGDISVLSAAAGYAEVRRIPLAREPSVGPAGMAVDPASRTIFVVFPDSTSTVVALGFDGRERARALVLGRSPDLALDPSRGLLVVATGTGLEFLAASTLASRTRVATGAGRRGAWHVALDPAAGLAVVSHSLLDEVALVSVTEFRVLGHIPVHAFPDEMEVLDGVLYVAAYHADIIDVVDLGEPRLLFSIPAGNGPSSVKGAALLKRVFVADDLAGQVTILEAGVERAPALWSVGHSIPDVALDAAQTLLFVPNPGSDTVEILNATTGAPVGSASVGNLPGPVQAVDLP